MNNLTLSDATCVNAGNEIRLLPLLGLRISIVAMIVFAAAPTSRAQTPWESAPAIPAQLPPGANNPSTNPGVPYPGSNPQVLVPPQTQGFGNGVPSSLVSGPMVNDGQPNSGAYNSDAYNAALVDPLASNRDADALREFDPGALIAVVGEERILQGDLSIFIEPIIEQNRDRIQNEEQEKIIRNQLIRKVLPQYVEIKAMYLEFFHDLVGTGSPKEINEMKKQVITRAGRIFFEKQVPTLFKKHEVDSVAALEEKLRSNGLSLVTLRSQFVEQVLANELERKYIPMEYEIERQQIMDYYREHKDEYFIEARAKWRELTIRFDKHETRAAAEALIKNLGNQIFLGGKPFEAVARESSEGFTAADGGVYDWTSRGSLKSKQIEQALFTLPLQRMSQVIEDEIGFHIIEVLEREEAHERDLAKTQVEIRKILSQERRSKEREKFRTKILARVPVWTLWPEDIPNSRPLSEAGGAGYLQDPG